MQNFIFLVVCVVTLLRVTRTYTNVTASELHPLYVISILPQFEERSPNTFKSGSSDVSTLTLVGQLAESYINNSTDLLPGYTLKLILDEDGSCAEKDGTSAVATLLRELFYHHINSESRNIAGIVGPICSSPTLTLSYQIAMPEISLAAVTMADSLTLSDRQMYSNTFSTVASSRLIVDTLIALMKTNSWNDVAIIYDTSEEYYKAVFRELQAEIQNNSSLSSFASALFDDFSLIRFNVPSIRVFFVLANPVFVQRVTCLASFYETVTIAYPNYQFVVFSDPTARIVNTVPLPFTHDGQTISCSVEDLRRVLNQAIILRYHLQPQNVSAESDAGVSYTDFEQELMLDKNQSLMGSTTFYAAVYFDAILAMAFALNNSMSSFNLSEFTHGQFNNTKLFRQELERLDFTGVSGPISFNMSTGFVNRNVDIYQLENNSLKLLEYYDSSTGQIERYTNESVNYIRGRFDQYLYASEFDGIFLTVLFLLIAVLLVCVQVLNVTHAEYPTIKASNPKITHFAFIGCYIMIVGAIVFITGESFGVSGANKCRYHHAYNCLLFIGWTTLFASLCARSFRIHRIFVHYLDPGRFIADFYLISFLLGVLLFAVLLVVGWSIFAGVKGLPASQEILNVRNGEPLLWIECDLESGNYEYWLLLLDGFAWSYALVACVLASLSVGKVKLRNFQISFIIVLCYCLFLLHVTIGLTVFILDAFEDNSELVGRDNISTDTLLVAHGSLQFASLCICLFLLFLPPVSPLLREKYKEHVEPKLTACFEKMLQAKRSS